MTPRGNRYNGDVEYCREGGLLRIALDLDGVLADTMKAWLRIWNKRAEEKLVYGDLVEWDFWRNLGISEDEFMDIMNDAWRMWKAIPPTEPNLSEKVSKLRSLGSVDVVTARPRETEKYVLNWLEHRKIIYDNYVWIRSSRMKPKLDYDVFIDDSPLLADGCILRRKLLLLYDQPWNRRVPEHQYVRRIKGLNEAYAILSRLRKK